MKKVLFTSHLANFVKFNKPFMQWFQMQGWEVHYASNDEEEIPYCDAHFKIDFHRSPYHVNNLKAYRQLKRLLKTEHYDIIHCHTPMGGVVTRFAAKGARKQGTKVIYTAHGFHFYNGAPKINWMLYYPMEKYLSRFTDCLVTINQEDYDAANSKGFRALDIQKIDGVGVDLGRFCTVSKEKKYALREEYNFSDQDYILICVAELNENKNQGWLIEQMPILLKDMPHMKVLFVGRGTLMNQYKQQVKRLELEDIVRFTGYCTDVEKHYAISDICISASYREGLAINIIEAMACGLPIVCTNIRGQRDLVQDGHNGRLYQLGDEEAFICAMKNLYMSEDIRMKIGANNVQKAKCYNMQHAIEQMGDIYCKYMKIKI